MAFILVIDDDEIVNAMIVQLLMEAGYDAEGARDGHLGILRLKSTPFDLVITDIVMPEKEGLETIIEIRKMNKTIPIIAISGGGKVNADQYLNMAKNLGADYALKKPIENEHLIGAVRECLFRV